MKIGGGGNETWMVALPLAGLAIVVSILFGGPEEALLVFEHLAYDTWDWIVLLFRR